MPMPKFQKMALIGSCMFVFSFIYGNMILPPVVKREVKKKAALKQGWQMRELWGKFPFSMDLNFNFFNVTNPNEISQGAKPILQEIGPFCYDQWQEKTNQIDHEEDDTVSFTFKNTYFFNAEKSKGLTGEEEIVVPNYLALGLVNVVLRERPTAVPIVAKAVDSIFKKPESIFMKVKVSDLLFNGIIIDCVVKDTAGNAICKEIKEKHEEFGMPMIEENKYLFSLWAAKNATDARERVRVKRGLKNLMEVGTVVEYNNKPNISVWNDEKCDKFEGTDGTIFHPFFDKKGKEELIAFNGGLCRSVFCHFDSESKISGIKTLRYTSDLGTDGNKNSQHKCYCESPDKCLKKGAYDAFKCLGLPMVFTNPHFYLADPYYLNAVEGLKPDKEKHMIIIDLEPNTGAPLHARTKAQANLFIMPVPKFKLMKNFPEALLPLFWIEEVTILPDFIVKEIKAGLRQMKMGRLSKYFMMLGGLGMCAYAGYIFYISQQYQEDIQVNSKPTMQTKNGSSNQSSADENKMHISTLRRAPVPPTIS